MIDSNGSIKLPRGARPEPEGRYVIAWGESANPRYTSATPTIPEPGGRHFLAGTLDRWVESGVSASTCRPCMLVPMRSKSSSSSSSGLWELWETRSVFQAAVGIAKRFPRGLWETCGKVAESSRSAFQAQRQVFHSPRQTRQFPQAMPGRPNKIGRHRVEVYRAQEQKGEGR